MFNIIHLQEFHFFTLVNLFLTCWTTYKYFISKIGREKLEFETINKRLRKYHSLCDLFKILNIEWFIGGSFMSSILHGFNYNDIDVL